MENLGESQALPQGVIMFLQEPSSSLAFTFQNSGLLARSRNHAKGHIEVGANTSLTIDQIEIDLDNGDRVMGDKTPIKMVGFKEKQRKPRKRQGKAEKLGTRNKKTRKKIEQ